jgi:hypothetical protein
MTVEELIGELTGWAGETEVVVQDSDGWQHWLLQVDLNGEGDRLILTYGPERVNEDD